MNHEMLKITHSNLMGWLRRGREQSVSTDEKLNVIMMALADMCFALGTDGSAEAAEAWYAESDSETE